jgi:hypothetical protein
VHPVTVNCISYQVFRSQIGHNKTTFSIQVNSAADGGQQVNVQEKKKTRKKTCVPGIEQAKQLAFLIQARQWQSYSEKLRQPTA